MVYAIDFARGIFPGGEDAFTARLNDLGDTLLKGQIGALIAGGKVGELYKQMLHEGTRPTAEELLNALNTLRDSFAQEMYGLTGEHIQNAPEQMRKVYEDMKDRLIHPLTLYQTLRKGPQAVQELFMRTSLEAVQEKMQGGIIAPAYVMVSYDDALPEDAKEAFMRDFKGDPQRFASSLAQELSTQLSRIVEKTLEERLNL